MAANPKQLRVLHAHHAGPDTRVLEVECCDGGAFDVVGGKYVIVHTGLTIGDKAIKRAYSLMPLAGRPSHASIAVKRFHGPGSRALHEVTAGRVLGFSGPWGKLVPDDGLAERTLLVATDTGITSALGIVEQSALGSGPRPVEVLWLRQGGETFLDLPSVQARTERAGVPFVSAEVPAVDAPSRPDAAWHLVDARARALAVTHVVATGDGAIVHPLRERLPQRVPSVRDVRIECFFRNPEKKSVS